MKTNKTLNLGLAFIVLTVLMLASVQSIMAQGGTWSTKASMPTPRTHVSAAVVNGIIYVFEGANSPGNSTIAVVEAYDPVTDTWTTKAPMPTPRFLTGVGVANGIAYVVGGHNGSA